jgi:hypothetical protein
MEGRLVVPTLATLRTDVPVFDTVEDLRRKGPRPNFQEHCHGMKSPDLVEANRQAVTCSVLRSEFNTSIVMFWLWPRVLCVGDQSDEARVVVQRLEVGVTFHREPVA